MERSDIILENLKQCKESTATENAKRKAVTNNRKKQKAAEEKKCYYSATKQTILTCSVFNNLS